MSPGLSWAEYSAAEAVNWTTLRRMERSPAHYQYELVRDPPADSDDFRLGRAVDTAVLEPESFHTRFVTWSGERRAGREWVAFRERAQAAGQDVLTLAQTLEAQAMQQAVTRHPVAARYLSGGQAQVAVLWTHERPEVTSEGLLLSRSESVACKGRLDYLHPELGIVDLKTSRDASPEAFSAQAWRLGYVGQAAFYVDGVARVTSRRLPYTLVVVEKTAPYAVAVYTVEADALELGRDLYRSLLDRLILCRATGRWPGYQDDAVQPLLLPRWARSEDENLDGLDLAFTKEEE